MSKLFVDEIHPKTTGGLITATGGLTSNVKEQLAMLCDGGTYTVGSGTYTSQAVTAVQGLTTSYVDLNGSSISYTPPTGTTMVMYQFIFHYMYADNYGIGHFKLFIDSDEATKQRTTLGANSNAQWQQTLTYLIPIGGSADTTTGRQATWTTAKTLKIQTREYGSSNEATVHKLFHWDGSGDSQTPMPKLIITALG